MKLMYFVPLLSTIGGQERTLTDKANYLVESGHEVLFVTYEHEGPLAYQLNPAVRHVDLCCHFFSLYRYPVYRRLIEALRLKRLFRRKLRTVVSQFCPDVIVVAIPNTENFICEVMAVAQDIPVIIESHLAYGHAVIQRGATEKWLYHINNPIRAVRKAELLIALTEGDADRWRSQKVKDIKVIPNPVTLYCDELPQIERHEGRIICAGRFTPQKRFDRLIDAFSLLADKYPSWNVDIFGEGEDKEKLRRQIVERSMVNRIRLLSPVRDIYREYQSSQFFVLSSDFEGFGLVIIEAMACGTPVVATNCPFGPSEIIEDGVTGLLAEMDIQDLADKMEWMITHKAECREMGNKAHLAAARFQKDKVIKEWEAAYLSVTQ